MPRLFPIAIFVAVVCLGPARAQEKPKSEPEAPAAAAPRPPTMQPKGKNRAASGPAAKERIVWPGMTRAGTVVLPNGWSLKPAGRQVRLGDLPVQIAVHPSEPILAILHAGYGEHEVVTASATTGKIIGRVSLPSSFSGLVWSHDGKKLFVGGGFDDKIYRFEQAEGLLSKKAVLSYPEPRVRTATCRRAWCFRRTARRFTWRPRSDTRWGGSMPSRVRFGMKSRSMRGVIPMDSCSTRSHNRLYVSLWSKARVAVVDTQAFTVGPQWAAQEHPNEMLVAHGGKILFVANANRNTVTVIDTAAGKAIETIGTAIDPKAPPGSTPSSLALSPDESLLLVSNANTNNLAVVNVKDPGGSCTAGFHPDGLVPHLGAAVGRRQVDLRGQRQGRKLACQPRRPSAGVCRAAQPHAGVHRRAFQGTLSLIAMPAPRQMAAYSQTVYECSPLKQGDPTSVTGAAPAQGHPIPAKVGSAVADSIRGLHHQGKPDL